jgi:hypothetical protein
MLGRKSLSYFNFKTGDLLINGNNTKTVLDKSGFIDTKSRRVAVNVLNDAESDLYKASAIENKSEFESNYEKINLEVNLDQHLLWLAILIFIFELFYIKRRGDL